LSVL